jgi:hypothetical protein
VAYEKEVHGLACGTKEVWDLYVKGEGFITRTRHTYRKAADDATDDAGNSILEIEESTTITIQIPEIPFTIEDIGGSLIEDVVNHQIALLNMNSADVTYAIRSNFPFYVEQKNLQVASFTRKLDEKGDEVSVNDDRVQRGTAKGVAYGVNMDAPSFIAPPSEPLEVSMKKEDQLKDEIADIVGMSVANAQASYSSVESKRYGDRSLESGLARIGLEICRGENKIAQFWAMYEGTDPTKALVTYPEDYNMLTNEQRTERALKLLELVESVPSQAFKKQLVKDAIDIACGTHISVEDVQSMKKEIDLLTVIATNPEAIREDMKEGLVSGDVASEARGYPKGDAKKARLEVLDKIAAILATQKAQNASGVPELQATGSDQYDKDTSLGNGKGDKT